MQVYVILKSLLTPVVCLHADIFDPEKVRAEESRVVREEQVYLTMPL